jgi:hypothetical protein
VGRQKIDPGLAFRAGQGAPKLGQSAAVLRARRSIKCREGESHSATYSGLAAERP